MCKCKVCLSTIDLEESYEEVNGDYYCSDCVETDLKKCDEYDEYYPIEDIVLVDCGDEEKDISLDYLLSDDNKEYVCFNNGWYEINTIVTYLYEDYEDGHLDSDSKEFIEQYKHRLIKKGEQ